MLCKLLDTEAIWFTGDWQDSTLVLGLPMDNTRNCHRFSFPLFDGSRPRVSPRSVSSPHSRIPTPRNRNRVSLIFAAAEILPCEKCEKCEKCQDILCCQLHRLAAIPATPLFLQKISPWRMAQILKPVFRCNQWRRPDTPWCWAWPCRGYFFSPACLSCLSVRLWLASKTSEPQKQAISALQGTRDSSS